MCITDRAYNVRERSVLSVDKKTGTDLGDVGSGLS
jgi:hypothetical protein